MSITRVVSEGLAHFSYFIANEGTASVIDPRRDCDVYLDLARKAGVHITRIFETHRNEDFVVGLSMDLIEWATRRKMIGLRDDAADVADVAADTMIRALIAARRSEPF